VVVARISNPVDSNPVDPNPVDPNPVDPNPVDPNPVEGPPARIIKRTSYILFRSQGCQPR